eukprot:c26728_g1_i1 orf=34-213(+)
MFAMKTCQMCTMQHAVHQFHINTLHIQHLQDTYNEESTDLIKSSDSNVILKLGRRENYQ